MVLGSACSPAAPKAPEGRVIGPPTTVRASGLGPKRSPSAPSSLTSAPSSLAFCMTAESAVLGILRWGHVELQMPTPIHEGTLC